MTISRSSIPKQVTIGSKRKKKLRKIKKRKK